MYEYSIHVDLIVYNFRRTKKYFVIEIEQRCIKNKYTEFP